MKRSKIKKYMNGLSNVFDSHQYDLSDANGKRVYASVPCVGIEHMLKKTHKEMIVIAVTITGDTINFVCSDVDKKYDKIFIGPEHDRGGVYAEQPDTAGKRLVDSDREAQYGNPVENMARIGKAWEAILGIPVSGHKAALCMTALKLVREAKTHKEDNLLDAEGYIEIARRVAESIPNDGGNTNDA